MPLSASPRTALVTGADAGLGREIVRLLAAERGTVLLHARTPEAAEQARQQLAGEGRAVDRIVPMGADFTDLGQVAALAQRVAREYPRVDLLVNNAGVFGSPSRAVTGDSHEVTFQVNYLAPYLLTRLLWPSLTAKPGSRVINVSSALHRGGRVHWGDVESSKRYSAVAAYAQSKLALNLFTRAVAVRGGADLIAVGVHPGVLATDMVRNYTRDTGRPAAEGAAAILALANGRVEDGAYYEGVAESVPNTLMDDKSSVDRLWKLSARLVGLAA
ncbi:SDR family NAD(P)-dependent oxidoreductase [Catenulispora sp. NL8]|uniref:SDR family NAD(P)-dependent oxidoreductase n=1 Tax=Catenulispora pinistramenti TaxID=2705254 RepID=A0ABS5L478_9ACTN|nr:SDR family NAD(P)-dependent oxidoreductase [Catenulispora pinistramenti]MBS2553030.1 SDR family NAD(P)-dependent oxidoreductase [Catenulispora pinistramenti]